MTSATRPLPHRTLYTWNSTTPAPAADARRHLQRALTQLDVPAEAIDDALVMVSELATNAHLHALGPYQLRLRLIKADIIVEVHDRDPHHPEAPPLGNPPDPDHRGGGLDGLLLTLAENGRGLLIVHELSQGQWGFRGVAQGKASWFALPSPG